ncbi:26S proteasome complex subunit SEM1, partial [Meleagris gallopavo]
LENDLNFNRKVRNSLSSEVCLTQRSLRRVTKAVQHLLCSFLFLSLDWTGLDEDEDAHVWEDNWDDDNVEDDFSNQLRAELEKHGYKMETS